MSNFQRLTVRIAAGRPFAVFNLVLAGPARRREDTHTDHDGARDAEVHLRYLLLELRQISLASSRRNLPYTARYLPVVPESFENKN